MQVFGPHVLENENLRVVITPYGGRIMSIIAPDREGRRADIVLGFDDPAPYAVAGGSFGALLGRCANRIAGGRFVLDGVEFQLSQNDHGATLHGGQAGFGTRGWEVVSATADAYSLSLISPDGDQGFPGELTVSAAYGLKDCALHLDFVATTTRPTPVNLSAHSYFNLAGHGDILDQLVTIDADAFLPTDARQIPTGEIRPVAGTLFDFRTPLAAGAKIRSDDAQLVMARGYDHCYVLNDGAGPAVRVVDPGSGRVLEIFTTQPGLQFYTGNSLNGSVVGRGGAFRQSDGFAFEAQGFPDAVNQPGFPSVVLRPGQEYCQTIVYRFGVESSLAT